MNSLDKSFITKYNECINNNERKRTIMKKFLCFAICAIFVLGLCSCDAKTLESFNNATPYELYEKSMQSVSEMTNYEIVHEQTVTTTAMLFIKFKVKQSTTIKVDGQNFYQVIQSDNEQVMQEIGVNECWYKDEMFYANKEDGALGKQHFSPEQFSGGIYDFSNGDGILLNIPEDMLKNTTFYQKGKDVYLELVLDGDSHYSLLMSKIDDLPFDLSETEDVIYRVYFHDDGKVDRIVTTYNFNVVQDGVSVKVTVDQVSTVKNIGTTTVDLPENAGSAPEGNWFYIR